MDASFKRSLRKVCPGNNDLCFYISWTLLFFLTQLSAVPEILVKNLWSVDTFVVSNEPVNANFDLFSKYNVFPHPKKRNELLQPHGGFLAFYDTCIIFLSELLGFNTRTDWSKWVCWTARGEEKNCLKGMVHD